MSDHDTHDASFHSLSDHGHVCIHEPERPGRRSFLGAAAATVGTFAAMPFAQLMAVSKRTLGARAAGEAQIAKTQRSAKTRLVLLGTAGGPPPVAGRAGIASALVVGDGIYLIDCGRSAVTQFMNAGLDLTKIKGFFVTHLHLDHVIDLFDFFALGLALPAAGAKGIGQPVPVYGPGRGAMSTFVREVPNPIGGDNPSPGTADLMRKSAEAIALQLNAFKLLNSPDVRDVIDVREIPVPAGIPVNSDRPPSMQPFSLFENDDVKVSTTLVPHVYASFAFRFDTDAGSFVLSGDTSKSDNVIALAKNADILVHEVGDIPGSIKTGLQENLAARFAFGHTDVREVGSIAQSAGAKHLVLSHFIPAEPGIVAEGRWRSQAKQGYDGDVIVGRDRMQVTAAGKHVRV